MSVAKGAVQSQRIPPSKRKWGANAKVGCKRKDLPSKRKGGVEPQRLFCEVGSKRKEALPERRYRLVEGLFYTK